ncbi:transcriptional regulator NanR [Salinicola rhizosphaerae]|uniref:GntR family transcriptional regulator n=1 Tax=Salinicola rhizosphaerae TaxID=1443141 RepID=A0ABQ3DUP1_9GAMM|nr:transcriptional regulator NanR [Salinicola rhizosphaerae]GHB13626.1 GntR family transcriptional regulator [Salinicola rhizosphaerae]
MSDQATGPIRRRKLSEEVLDRLLALIQSQRLQPGDQLPPERELMSLYGVGRPAIREAMQQLASMGRITINHGERARVSEVTVGSMISQFDTTARFLLDDSDENIDHLKQARVFFETGMARLAAEKATPNDIETLRRLIDEMQASEHGEAFIERDMAFHHTIAAMTGNPIFAATARAMLHWLKDYYVGIVSFRGAEDVSIREHHDIVERLAANDPAGAERAMRDHLNRASDLYRQRAADASS